MTTSAASPNGHRLLAVIAPGAGPHLVGAPATSHWTTRAARPRVSLADELADRLTLLDEDPEGFLSALRDVCMLHGERVAIVYPYLEWLKWLPLQ